MIRVNHYPVPSRTGTEVSISQQARPMIPKHVMQERIDRAVSRPRPRTPEEDADDVELMERLYQEDLRRQTTPSGTAVPTQAGAEDGVSDALGGSSATTPGI